MYTHNIFIDGSNCVCYMDRYLRKNELKVNNMTHKYKKNLHSILLSPFNYDKWTQ